MANEIDEDEDEHKEDYFQLEGHRQPGIDVAQSIDCFKLMEEENETFQAFDRLKRPPKWKWDSTASNPPSTTSS